MDLRGPQEVEAPGDPMDPLFIGHSGNTSSKNNNRLFFLTVEYVEDHRSRDYTKMFMPYEQVSFSPRAVSPLSDFEHRVSPLDPNMSSTARYSPTPVQLPSVPFQNSVVLQDPPSPLIAPTEPSSRSNINYVSTPNNHVPIVTPTDNVTDFVNNTSEDGSVTSVGSELILMQSTNNELGASSAPLMLTNIPGTEFVLARDFLVMHDEQLSIMNTLANQNSDIIEEQIAVVDTNSQTIQQPNDENTDVCQKTRNDETSDLILKNYDDNTEKCDVVATVIPIKTDLRRSKRKINDKNFSCEECNAICSKCEECACRKVRTIADQPVPSRAVATLPGSYLTLNKLSNGNTTKDLNYGVFAKRNIRRRTQFGPIEGILCPYNGELFDNVLPLLYETSDKQLLKIDVSNEDTSNWMRFVRPALNYNEQNLVICQQNDGIFFLTTRDIMSKEELKAGPSPEYANNRNLQILQSDPEDKKMTINSGDWVWPCYECNQSFRTCQQLQKHLNVHNNSNLLNNANNKTHNKRRKLTATTDKSLKVVDGQTLLYTCPHCPKVFPRSYSLKRHMLMHPGSKTLRYECTTCGENFLHPYNRNRHIKIFHSEETREKENTLQNANEWKCFTCSLTFDKSCLLNIHMLTHGESIDNVNEHNESSACPQCGVELKTHRDLINHVSKHGRMKLPKTPKISPVLSSHKCTMCYKRFATKVRLQQHYLVHGAEDKKPLPCNVCFKRFMNNSALACHLKTHRQDKQIFECPMCRQLFNQVLMLKEHIETHKNPDETFTCPHCSRTFTKYSVIRKHIRAHHCERKHKCQFCVKCFPTVDKLRMHLLRHSDHREFHCANCEKRFKRKDKLKEHMTRMHDAQRTKKDQQQAQNNQTKKFIPKVNPTDYNRFVYKCHQCLVGFKRRGMLVNHLAKRHPDVSPDSVPELNMPILRQTRDYYCQYCEKVYKSSSKRKAHIMKNHPGAALPPSNRQKETDVSGLPNPTFCQTVGSITTSPQSCQWCHKQYASKAKLLQHQRKKHSTLMEPADQIPRPRNRLSQNQSPPLNNNNFIIPEYIPTYDITNDIKPKIIKISNDVDLIPHSLEIVGQQFVRIRDIR